MPAEDKQVGLQQPWKAWEVNLRAATAEVGGVTVEDAENNFGTSQHGTIALDPRNDVDLKSDKAKPLKPVV